MFGPQDRRRVLAEQDLTTLGGAGDERALVSQQGVDRLDHARTMGGGRNYIGGFLHCWERVGNCHRAATRGQKGMVVLSIADGQDVKRRKLQRVESCSQTCRLVNPRRHHHDRPLVEDDLPLKAQFTNALQHGSLVRLPSSNDATAH
jgi:hypothetical protein